MATNNSTNNTFPSGMTATGTITLNGSGSGANNIGSSASGAFNIASGSNSTYTLNNNTFTLTTGTGNLNIGDDATVKDINIGGGASSPSVISSAAFVMTTTGNNRFSKTGDGGIAIINNGGNISMDGSSGTNLGGTGSSNTALTFNIGTAAGDIPMQFGNTNGVSALSINQDAGGGFPTCNIGTSGDKTINIGNSTGTTALTFIGKWFDPINNVTGTTANLIPGVIHVINSGVSLCSVTLPTTCPLGTIITVAGFASGGWIVLQNIGQSIKSTASSTTTGATGTLASSDRYNCVQLECITADTTWVIKSFTGTLTFV
jgi:hypothetical protein